MGLGAEIKEIRKEVSVEKPKKKEKAQPLDVLDNRKNVCPWCNFDNQDETIAETHSPVENNVRPVLKTKKYQCDTCGKMWEKAALGKPYSIELERGDRWKRETAARAFLR